MRRPARSTIVFAVAIATLAALSVVVQVWRDRAAPPGRLEARYLYVASDAVLSRVMLSFKSLAADLYWIRAIQHYGGDRLSKDGRARYELLYPLLDITTTLDPRFTIAYRFGALFLAEPFPGGPGRSDQAIALLQKGLRAEPEKWQYLHDIAFVHYWQRGDPVTAAHWLQRAGSVPGAPNWVAPLAATMLVRGGDRTASRFLWSQLRDSADQEWLRNLADLRLVQLQAMDQIDQLEALVRRFDSQAGPGLLTWERLVRAGVLRGVPRDPSGTPYDLEPRRGTVTVSPTSPLFPMPTEPPSVRRPVS